MCWQPLTYVGRQVEMTLLSACLPAFLILRVAVTSLLVRECEQAAPVTYCAPLAPESGVLEAAVI